MTFVLIPLDLGPPALVDGADSDLVAGFRWRRLGNGYVQAQRGEMYLYLHRLIAGAGPHQQVDHINGDRLDNRLGNLRIATPSQNNANRAGMSQRAGASSDYKGVSWNKERQRWRAYISIGGKSKALGSFADEHDAARAYNAAALAEYGEFARLNVITEGIMADAQ